MTKKLMLIISAIIIFACALSASPVSINGQLKVTGLQLTSECNRPVQLRGVSTHGLQWWGSCYTDAALDYAAYTLNADSVRLAMYTAQNGYLSNPAAYTSMVDSLVDKIGARGMYAIIDWHILEDCDPNSNSLAAKTFFEHEATLHKDKKYVIYEICNEPNNTCGSVTWAMVKQYANFIIPKIRAIDPDSVIIVGTPNWSQLGWDVAYDQLSYPNILYAFHFYAGSHGTGMLTPFLNQMPIFCSEWGPTNSSGNGGDDYVNAQAFMDIMSGVDTVSNPTGVKISWNEWTFSSSSESSAMLNNGTCGSGPWDTSNLTTAGLFVYNNMNNPPKAYYCGTLTPTITGTPPTPTITPTITVTPTNLPSELIYDGDTPGLTLADGVAAANAWKNAGASLLGTISETTGGNGGNGMALAYSTPAYWQGHTWTKTVTVGTYNSIAFDVKTTSGSVSALLFTLEQGTVRASIASGNTWKTMIYPLSKFFTTVPATFDEFDFVNNSGSNYSVIIDNIRLVFVPSATATPTKTITPTWTMSSTYTNTPTITQTGTITPTSTITPTITLTPTVPAKTVRITKWDCYPNPFNGSSKITFRYTIAGFAEKLNLDIYTFGERKIARIAAVKQPAGVNELEWTPPYKLGSGLYYYTVEGINGSRPPSRHVGAFVVVK